MTSTQLVTTTLCLSSYRNPAEGSTSYRIHSTGMIIRTWRAKFYTLHSPLLLASLSVCVFMQKMWLSSSSALSPLHEHVNLRREKRSESTNSPLYLLYNAGARCIVRCSSEEAPDLSVGKTSPQFCVLIVATQFYILLCTPSTRTAEQDAATRVALPLGRKINAIVSILSSAREQRQTA